MMIHLDIFLFDVFHWVKGEVNFLLHFDCSFRHATLADHLLDLRTALVEVNWHPEIKKRWVE